MTPAEANQLFAAQLQVAEDVFVRPVVALELPPGQERRPDAMAGFALAANLLARTFTKLHLVAPDAQVATNPWRLSSLRDLLEPLRGVTQGVVEWSAPARADIAVGIGAPSTLIADRTVTASFDGWEAAVDYLLDNGRPGLFGALFSACYASAQAFLHAVSIAGGTLPKIKPFRLSLLDYMPSGANATTPDHVDFGVVHLVGVGAVGSALVYGLGHLPSMSGEMYLIDNDCVDDSNLNRYVLIRRQDVRRAKSEVAGAALTGRALRLFPKHVEFGQFRREDSRPIELLITPVDSEAGRRALAKHLPREVLNAATGNSAVTVSRHGFADGKACLHCLYLPPFEQVTTESRLSKDLGVPLAEIEHLLANNAPVSAEFVRRVEHHRGVPDGSLEQFVGLTIQSFYQRAICSTAPVTIGTTTIVSPLSFISAAAGVLLAAELVKVKSSALRKHALDNYFRFDLLYAPNPSFRQRRAQDTSGRCICHEVDFVEVYRERFATPS